MRLPRRRDESGQLSILILGFTVVAALLMVVVVVATKAYLTRRALVSYADGAAVTAAQQVSEASIYRGGVQGSVPLDTGAAAASVADYAARNGLGARFAAFRVVDVEVTRAGAVRVVLAAVSPVPFADAVTRSYAGGVPLQVEATAESTLQ